MKIFVVDPGNEKSAFVKFDTDAYEILDKAIVDNLNLLALIQNTTGYDLLVVEYPKPRGQPMYYQLVDTIFWIGRFVQAAQKPWQPVDRKDIKMHLTGSTRTTDSNIRAALIERYFEKSRGQYTPGAENRLQRIPDELKGISKDLWAALAIAIYYSDTQKALKNMLN